MAKGKLPPGLAAYNAARKAGKTKPAAKKSAKSKSRAKGKK